MFLTDLLWSAGSLADWLKVSRSSGAVFGPARFIWLIQSLPTEFAVAEFAVAERHAAL